MATPTQYTGIEVLDEQGESIGKIKDVLFDGSGRSPTWFVVKQGLLRREHYLPTRGSYRTQDDRIVVPFTVRQVKSAPKAARDHVVTNSDRAMLGRHYHLDRPA